MNNHELLQRQQALLLRSAQLRFKLKDQVQVFRRPLGLADSAQSGLQWLYRNPAWPIGAATLLLVLRPKRTIAWAGRAWWVWKSYRRVQDWLARPP
jgi:hypothetical protein